MYEIIFVLVHHQKYMDLSIVSISTCIQDSYDMFEMNGDMDKKKKKKMKKKEKLEGMKKEMDIVSDFKKALFFYHL